MDGIKTAGTAKRKIVIVGSANVGKSILFNKFSKAYSIVSNYAQTTFKAIRKDADFGGKSYEIVDTPGLFSLNVLSDDERITRDVLLTEKPELLIFCGDAKNLKNSLILLSQVMELEIPTLFCLNMIDEARKKGIEIDSRLLSEKLGMAVVKTAAILGLGLSELEEAGAEAHYPNIDYPPAIREGLRELTSIFPAENRPSKGKLLLLLAGDERILELAEMEYGASAAAHIKSFLEKFHRQVRPAMVVRLALKSRSLWAAGLLKKVLRKKPLLSIGFGEIAARISRHPVFGWPILLAVLWVIFEGVGNGANFLATWLDNLIFLPFTSFISSLVPQPFLNDFLVGNFGVLTMGIENALGTVIPILLIFFLLLNFLEDVGYLPNLSVLLNNLLRPMGLTGKAVLPMVLGFGCNTMATLTTRTLDTPRERFIASFLIALGFPCAVQLGVMLAILATAPFSALLIVIFTVAATQIVCGLALNRLMPARQCADFLIELPTFRMPHWNNILRKTWFRLKWFMKEALPMFVFAALLMFTLDKTGLLAIIEAALKPIVVGFLSLPQKVTEVFILVLSRREVGAVYFKDMVDAGTVDYYQTVVGLIVITLFIPCFSNTMVMIKELGMKRAVLTNALVIIIAILVGGAANFLIRFW